MYCDIYMYAEIMKDNQWYKVKNYFLNNKFKPQEENYINEFGDKINYYRCDHPYQDKNYNLFSILANIRNDNLDQFDYISVPRGIPVNISPALNKIIQMKEDNIHSISYIYLNELIKFNWCKKISKRVLLNEKNFLLYQEGYRDLEYFENASYIFKNYKIVYPFEMKELLKENDIEDNYYFTMVKMNFYYYQLCEKFVTETIPSLLKLSSKNENNDVRIVFWFDG